MTRHDLPRCPFCGAWPEQPGGVEAGTVCCGNGRCVIAGVQMSEDDWKTRPLEAEYDVDLLHARQCFERMDRNLEQARINVEGLLPLIDSMLQEDRKAGRLPCCSSQG